MVNSIAPLCGFVTGTSYNYTIDTGPNHLSLTDTLKTYSGRFRFKFTCTAGSVDGYNVADTVKYEERNGFTFYNSFGVTQDYTVKALDQIYKLVSMDGTLTFSGARVRHLFWSALHTRNSKGVIMTCFFLLLVKFARWNRPEVSIKKLYLTKSFIEMARHAAQLKNWWKDIPFGRLQKINIYTGFIGVIISIGLSVFAVYLTHKYGENKDQINTLTKVASQQQQQLDALRELLKQGQTLEGINGNELTQLKTSNEMLASQIGLLGRQIYILDSDQRLANKIDTLSMKANSNKLKNTITMIGEMETPYQLSKLNTDFSSQLEALNTLQQLLQSELSNTFLLENSDASHRWAVLYLITRSTIRSLSSADSLYNMQYIENGIVKHRRSTTVEVNMARQDMFNGVVNELDKTILYMWTNVIRKLKTDKFLF